MIRTTKFIDGKASTALPSTARSSYRSVPDGHARLYQMRFQQHGSLRCNKAAGFSRDAASIAVSETSSSTLMLKPRSAVSHRSYRAMVESRFAIQCNQLQYLQCAQSKAIASTCQLRPLCSGLATAVSITPIKDQPVCRRSFRAQLP